LGAVDGAGAAGVAAAVLRVTDALAEQGAPGGAVLLALEDAFAALLAGQRHPAERERVHALAERAKTLAASRLRGADVGA
jgi:hypothetical protein